MDLNISVGVQLFPSELINKMPNRFCNPKHHASQHLSTFSKNTGKQTEWN